MGRLTNLYTVAAVPTNVETQLASWADPEYQNVVYRDGAGPTVSPGPGRGDQQSGRGDRRAARGGGKPSGLDIPTVGSGRRRRPLRRLLPRPSRSHRGLQLCGRLWQVEPLAPDSGR